MNRRDALRRVAVLLGGTLSAPTLTGVLGGCRMPSGEGWSPEVLSAAQDRAITVIAETIIPETDTPGAMATHVNRFIDTFLAESVSPGERERFLNGLEEAEARCQETYGAGIAGCAEDERHAFLETLDDQAFRDDVDLEHPPFFRVMKELTLVGYYTSQVGGSQELRINMVPGYYDGCVAFDEVGRAWSA